MEKRTLGSAGLVSSAIGLGTAAFTGAYGPVTRRECARLVALALDIGITMFDTADYLVHGEMERLVGQALSRRGHGRGQGEDVLVATQGGARRAGPGRPWVVDGSPEYLARACDASLRRLRTDQIDLFYLHKVDPRVPLEDSVGKLADLVVAGKIRYLGLCGASAEELRLASEVHPISVVAVEYSLSKRTAERAVLTAASELGVGAVACCPLDRGALTRCAATARTDREAAAMRALEAQAAELDLGMARLALAWLLAQRDDIVPVPSTRSLAHLEMNASAPSIRLPPDVCARLGGLWTDPDSADPDSALALWAGQASYSRSAICT